MPTFKPYSMILQEEDGTGADIYILGDIVDGNWCSEVDGNPAQLVKELSETSGNEVTVHINSAGGDMSAGIAIYNILKNCGKNVTTVCEGFACSAASMVFMAGRERIMRESSLLMIHNGWTVTQGNADQLRETADVLEKLSSSAAKIYSENCSISEDDLDAMLKSEAWITAEEALQMGFATGVDADEKPTGVQSSAFQLIRSRLLLKETSEREPEPKPVPAFNAVWGY